MRAFMSTNVKRHSEVPMICHEKDSDCTLDPETDCCIECHVYHGDPCPECSGHGFHVEPCSAMSDEEGS